MHLIRTIIASAAIAAIALPVAAAAPKGAILPSVISVDTTNHTAVLPIHRGDHNGTTVWYIVTDSSDASVAHAQRVVYSASLASLDASAVASAALVNGVPEFVGIPDFSPTRTYVASAGGFPPKAATPGSVADARYSPFVRIQGTPGVLNAPIVAAGNGPFDVTHHTNTEDRVVAIDTVKRTVTVVLARGFHDGSPIYYISTEASDPVAAAVERATYVPRLANPQASATIPLGVIVNGVLSGSDVQGLAYLALRTPLGADATRANAGMIGSPFNVLSQIPDTMHPSRDDGYSPLWVIEVLGSATKRITGYANLASRVKPAGFVVNCPVIAFGDSGGY